MVREINDCGETFYVITIRSSIWHNHPFLEELRTQGLEFLIDWGRWGTIHLYYQGEQYTNIWFKDSKQAVWFGLKWGC